MIKVYIYAKCSTCRNAIKWLENNDVAHHAIPIRETPPPVKELKFALGQLDGEIKRLFNTSGMDYRAMNMNEKLPSMSEAEALKLLSSNGNLIKRPLLISAKTALAGFKADQWKKTLGS